MDDLTFLERFASCTVEPFGHREHVRAAWACLRAAPTFEQGALRFCTLLRRFAAHKGDAARYSETITWAHLALVAERALESDGGFATFAAANPDLMAGSPSVLQRFYDAETLHSERARRVFLLPRR